MSFMGADGSGAHSNSLQLLSLLCSPELSKNIVYTSNIENVVAKTKLYEFLT